MAIAFFYLFFIRIILLSLSWFTGVPDTITEAKRTRTAKSKTVLASTDYDDGDDGDWGAAPAPAPAPTRASSRSRPTPNYDEVIASPSLLSFLFSFPSFFLAFFRFPLSSIAHVML